VGLHSPSTERIVRRVVTTLSLLLVIVATPAIATSAVASAQRDCALTSTLRRGARSEQVRCLESLLVARGYSLTGPDTFFGTSTVKAVKAFQADNGLRVDGIVGPVTRQALGQAAAAAPATVPAAIIETRVIGTSVQGREITAYRMGTPGGRVVLGVGVIHGDEAKGAEITKLLRTLPTPAGVDLWIIDTVNPDGLAAATRQNANRVDLNRNFERKWNYIPLSADNGQYSGEAPADQPETQAVQAFVREIQPAITVWWHQDANRVSVAGARPAIGEAYAKKVKLTTASTPCTAGCTGTATQFMNKAISGGTAFIVELPNSRFVDAAMIALHAKTFLAVITL
jgi:peptidoglycan hydrolase-like protein with peptidoglycan-binding domain